MINVTLDVDSRRDTSYFRYENPGLKELTFRGNYSGFSSNSRTGYSFRQEENYNLFPIPRCTEMWVKFDWKFAKSYTSYISYNDIKCYTRNNSKVSGFRFNYDAFNMWANSELAC